MPAPSINRLCGLLFCFAFIVPSIPVSAESSATESTVTEPTIVEPTNTESTAPQSSTNGQPPATAANAPDFEAVSSQAGISNAQLNAAQALRYSHADSAWICTADGDDWNCQQGPKQIESQKTDRSGIEVDPADNRYRLTYPAAYATEAHVLSEQEKARQQWLKSNRESSTPEGVKEASALYQQAPYAFLDWYPNPGGISPLSHCEGSYIEPAFDPDLANADDLPFTIQADFSRTLNDSITELFGDIHLKKGNSQAYSQRARLNHASEQAELSGLIQIREPGILLLGERAQVDTASSEATIDKAQYVFHQRHLRGSAEQIVRRGNDLIISQGSYTRCEPENTSWSLSGSEIVLHKETGLGEVTHATLRLADVPVFYLPYMTFPITNARMSGFLFPTVGFTSNGGIDYTQPYYFNLAPNYDDTLTFRHIGDRGSMIENEFRYLDTFGSFDLGLGYMPEDADRNGDKRWILGVDHSGSPAKNWTTSLDYTSVSDSDYFDDLGTNLNLSEQSHLDQLAEAHYRDQNLIFDAQMHDYQTIDDAADRPYRKIPALRLSWTPDLDYDLFGANVLSDLTQFDRDPTDFTGIDRSTGTRAHLETDLDIRYDRPWGYLKPGIKLIHTEYQLSNQPSTTSEAPSRTLPVLSFDSGLYFDRPFDFEDQDYTQTLEPRLFLLEVPFADQSDLPNFDSAETAFGFNQLFRDNRFSGYDRIGDTSQATLGLTSRLLDDRGSERGNISVGQIHFFKDRQVRLDANDPALTEARSNLVAEGLWNVTDRFRITADSEWNRSANKNLTRNLKLAYRSDIDHLANLSYRFTDDEVEQTDLTAIWPLSTQWSMLGRWQHDLINNESLDLIAGFEYENCCWMVRTTYRQWVTDDIGDDRVQEAIFFQFVLKGLGGLDSSAIGSSSGSDADHFLKDISGYEERSNYE
ncbi:MAG: LPS assembly protein LptD [Motiliproteus sp.]